MKSFRGAGAGCVIQASLLIQLLFKRQNFDYFVMSKSRKELANKEFSTRNIKKDIQVALIMNWLIKVKSFFTTLCDSVAGKPVRE